MVPTETYSFRRWFCAAPSRSLAHNVQGAVTSGRLSSISSGWCQSRTYFCYGFECWAQSPNFDEVGTVHHRSGHQILR